MGCCCVPGCKHENKARDSKCRMFTFPRDLPTKRKWQIAVRKGTQSPRKLTLASPNKNWRVCSCHFKDGNKSFGPTIFPWNVRKQFHPPTPEKHVSKQSSTYVVRKLNLDQASSQGQCSGENSSVPTLHSGSPVRPNLEDVTMGTDSYGNEDSSMSIPYLDPPQEEESSTVIGSPIQPNFADATAQADFDAEIISEKDKKLEDIETQNLVLKTEVCELRKQLAGNCSVLHAAEKRSLKSEVERLEKELKERESTFLFETIADKDNLVSHFTGLPNKQTFYALLHLFDDFDLVYVKGWKVQRLTIEKQLFLTLLKLRRGISNDDLAVRFKIGKATVANVFLTFLMALHHLIGTSLLHIPSRGKNKQHLPECFDEYPNTRIILDCTEVTTANLTLLSNQGKMYSSYKHKITSKALVGIAPNGTVTFVSDLYVGSTSDRDIVIDSGVLKHLVPGDTVMGDKGFNIEDLMPDGVTLNMPPFKDAPEFTEEQVNETFGIAKARIHVERAINRIKRFEILGFIPQFMVPYASEVFRVCAALTNFQKPLIKHFDEED